MGPRLASLALLLLALCRQSSCGMQVKIESLTTMATTSTAAIIPKQEAAKITETIAKPTPDAKELTDQEKIDLMKNLGNTMIGLALLRKKANLPEYIATPLEHGMMCEAGVTGNEDRIKKYLYNNEVSSTRNDAEIEEFGALDNEALKIDCKNQKSPPLKEEDCLCKDKKAGVWCMLVHLERAVPAAERARLCPLAALNALKDAGSKTLGKFYDVDAFAEDKGIKELIGGDAKAINTLTKDEENAINFYCDALNPKVEKAVAELYRADVSYWLSEGIVYALLFGPAATDLEGACKNPAFSNSNEYGKCVCKKDTGFSFCIYKVLAEFFKEAGFLNCVTKKFDNEKKPTAVPKIAAPKTSAAATSTLLLAPTAAAMLLLLRH